MSPPYVYQDLTGQASSIRLLRLFPSMDASKPIQGELFEYSLQDMFEQWQPYDALSYVWGEMETSYSIELDGRSRPVTVNLQSALSSIRHKRRVKLIWVDALCINQDNNEEKKHQIGLMRHIYGCSNCVIVWLGETKDESDEALEDLRMIGAQWHVNSNTKAQITDRIMRLFQRPWFRRIWVLQEVAAARHIQIRCGHCEMDGYAFGAAANSLKLDAHRDLQDIQNMIRSVSYLMQGSVFRPPYNASVASSDGICTFGELIDMFHDREATVPQDKVYALLGMSSTDMSSSDLLPDYTLSPQKLFEKLVGFVISTELPVECHKEKEIARIDASGYILGKVLFTKSDQPFNNMQRVSIRWRRIINDSFDFSSLILRTSKIPVRPGDVICLLDGASALTIIRTYLDFSIIVIALASSSTDSENVNTARSIVSNAVLNKLAKRSFILIWDWHYSFETYSLGRSHADWAKDNSWEIRDLMKVREGKDLPFRHHETAVICMDAHGLLNSCDVFNQTLMTFEEFLLAEEWSPIVEEWLLTFFNNLSLEPNDLKLDVAMFRAWIYGDHTAEQRRASEFFEYTESGSSGSTQQESSKPTQSRPRSEVISILFSWSLKKGRNRVANLLQATGQVDPDFEF